MIMAIFIILLIAAGGTLLLTKISTGSHSVAGNYIRTQEELLAQSATEYALMQAQGIDTSAAAGNHCLNFLDITVNDSSGNKQAYQVNVTLSYSFRGPAPAGCTTLSQNTGKDTMVLIDVDVKDNNLSLEETRFHQRSWQQL